MIFRPLSIAIGLRYTRAKKRSQFVSFISLMSMLGIALGVLVLITVLSVMNGFDQQIREKLFQMVPHLVITNYSGKIENWQQDIKKIEKNPNVTSVVPIASGQGLLSVDNQTAPVIVNGILSKEDPQIMDLARHITEGSLKALNQQSFGIILGAGVAANLNVVMGDRVNLITPKANFTPVGVVPRFKQFKVVGIFHSEAGFGFDSGYAFINMQDAQRLFMLGSSVTALQINVKNLFSASSVAWDLQKNLGGEYQATDWTEQFGAFYHAVQMEKTMMFFILLLIVAVAVFNLVSSLMMAVNDKQADIAILRTLGATPKIIMMIFIIQGGLIGCIGTLLGVLGGVVLSLNVTSLVNMIQRVFHVRFLNPDIYFVDFLPSDLQFQDVWHIGLIAVVMSLLATLYPAWRASRVQPAEALRYE